MRATIPSDFQVNPDPIARSLFSSDVYDWWGHMLNLPEVHKHTTGKDVHVAVLDTGSLYAHPDLYQHNYIDFTPENDRIDHNGHGTHVHGMLSMRRNGAGFIGTAPDCLPHIMKVMQGDGVGQATWILKALEACLEMEVDWVTMSLGIPREVPMITKRIRQLQQKDIGVSVAAGNDRGQVLFPAFLDHCIATGAHDQSKLPAGFSNIGQALDIMAPGVHVKSTWNDGGYREASGTSMAAPIVGGVAALIIELERNWGG